MWRCMRSDRYTVVHNSETDNRKMIEIGTYYVGGAENDGHENDGPSKLQGMKLQDMKLTDQIAGHENAGHEIARYDKNC